MFLNGSESNLWWGNFPSRYADSAGLRVRSTLMLGGPARFPGRLLQV